MRQMMFAQRYTATPNVWDGLALCFILGFIVLFAWTGHQMTRPFHVGEPVIIHLAPAYLPMYALSTVVRMFLMVLKP